MTSFKHSTLSLIGMLLFALTLWGCPDGDVDNPAKTNNKTNPDACAKVCEPGETRCQDGNVEACSVNGKGCYTWDTGRNCPAAGLSCDDAVQPATCITNEGTCSDSTKNQDETDTDCGGLRCDACLDGKSCAEDSDCSSSNCDKSSFTCAPPVQAGTCVDGIKNQDESDSDCGGATCPKCADDKVCTRNEDCTSSACDMSTNTCTTPMENPSCMDNIKNQDETDADCGGATCGKCAIASLCVTNTDCVTDYCDMITKKCETPPVMETCMDGIKNQDETDTDCGGATCNKCLDDKVCTATDDCQSGNCDVGKTDKCVPAATATCVDGVKNQDETDTDCGGGCMACALGKTCVQTSDCAMGVCDFTNTNTCIDATPQYEVNEDFETNDFSLFPYAPVSNSDPANNWVIEQDAAKCHMGSYCMRTNPNHQLDEVTSTSVSLSVRQNTQITFWAKTNSEPNEHFFRFFIDGVQVLELSGQNDWMQYSFPVMATGPNGQNRVFKWEFTRSSFVDPNHVPWIETWVDDIDFPDWNTEPTTPELIAPWNGTVTTNAQPTLRWRSFDPDFDPITYEIQWDTDPAFGNPDTTGETNDTQHQIGTALQDKTVYYWRARAKDNSNYRWSDWTTTWSFAVDTAQTTDQVWRQSDAAQFSGNTLEYASLDGDGVAANPTSVSRTIPNTSLPNTIVIDNLPTFPPNTPATIKLNFSGDFNSSSEYADVTIGGQAQARFNPTVCTTSKTYSFNDINSVIVNGKINIQITLPASVDAGGCNDQPNQRAVASVGFNVAQFGTPSMISSPISFATFNNKKYWEKIHMVGTGALSLQILDAQGALIPDSQIPNNSTGSTSRSLHLWTLDPVMYPTIRLKVTMGNNARLEEWSVHGDDRFEFTFERDGDAEGWVGLDRDTTPTTSVTGGVLRFDTSVDGTDPRIVYVLPQPVDATRFTTVAVRIKTSNNYMNDNVSFLWASNFGQFDVRRSFTEPNIFLQSFQDITFDLTTVPMMPNEVWQGQIEGIRLDPVEDFFDQLNMPSAGWFEVESISIY